MQRFSETSCLKMLGPFWFVCVLSNVQQIRKIACHIHMLNHLTIQMVSMPFMEPSSTWSFTACTFIDFTFYNGFLIIWAVGKNFVN